MENIEVARSLNHPDSLLSALSGLSEQLIMQGRFIEAEAFLREGLGIGEPINHRFVGGLYFMLGALALYQSKVACAHSHLHHSLTQAKVIDDRQTVVFAQLLLSELARSQTHYERAAEWLDLCREEEEKLRDFANHLLLWQTANCTLLWAA